MKLYHLLKQSTGNRIYLIAALIIVAGICNLMLLRMLSDLLTENAPSDGMMYIYPAVLAAFFFTSRISGQMILKIGLKNTVFLRKEIIQNVSKTSFSEFENIGKESVLTSLTTDTLTLSHAPAVLTLIFSSLSTIVVCFVYLAMISVQTFLFMSFMLTTALLVYLYILKGVWRDTRHARAVEDLFFKYIGDLLGGFRELKINEYKKNDLMNTDLLPAIHHNYEMRWRSGSRFADATLVVSTFFYLILGGISFAMVFWFRSSSEVVITYLLMMIFLLGPIKTVMGNYQNLLQLEVAAGKVMELLSRLDQAGNISEGRRSPGNNMLFRAGTFKFIQLQDVSFSYPSADGFGVGPVNLRINKGEVLFIAGGNGSGKTTLIQLLLGLYQPTSGKILMDNKNDIRENLAAYTNRFSVIYSDFYLFHKLYGIDRIIKKEEADKNLNKLRLQHKVSVVDNAFTDIALSQGQKKRLALLTAFFEDKEILILDEFAADQDPEFREYFYTTLLSDLKKANKTVIAITHDDKYYHCCDRFIKLDVGKIVEEKTNDFKTDERPSYV